MTLLEVAKSYIGKDASPKDDAPDELGCVDTVTTILREVYPHVPHMLSTIEFNKWLNSAASGYVRVASPQPEDIIISPTSGKKIGHVGICLENGSIASNDSGIHTPTNKGKFLVNYTFFAWCRYYSIKQGLPVYIYRKV